MKDLIFLVFAVFSLSLFGQSPKKIAEQVEVGRQLKKAILEKPGEYPILPEKGNEEAYQLVRELVNEVLKSPKIKYADEFKYDSVTIIKDDNVLNAFCAPGGYVFVYTGIMKYVKSEDELAGILGHEIAHAELWHGTRKRNMKLTTAGALLIGGIAAGAVIGELILIEAAGAFVGLGYSRKQEAQADKYSVLYLKDSPYSCGGCGQFFDNTLREGDDVRIPEFLSDHPDTRKRVANIYGEAEDLGCLTPPRETARIDRLKQILP
jgi:predicted Zn-dependent protease